MESLKPITILLAGTLTLGFVLVGLVFCLAPGADSWSDAGLLFGLGAVMGLGIFGPVAAGVALRKRLPRWLCRWRFRIEWYTSLAMALSFGYVAASVYHRTFDKITALGFAVVILGAAIKTVLGAAFEQPRRAKTQPPPVLPPAAPKPPDGQLPGAPVPNPSGGHPPALSAEARVEDEAEA